MTFISDDDEIQYCGKDMEEAYQLGKVEAIVEIISEVRRLEGKCRAPYHDYHCEIQCPQCEWDSIPRKMVLDMLNGLNK